jgi:Flp pilus assembly protein TadB
MQPTTPSQSRKNMRRTVLVWGIPALLVILLVFADSAPWWLAIIAILWLLVIWCVSSSERKKTARRRAAARARSRSRHTGVPRVSQRWESDPRGQQSR